MPELATHRKSAKGLGGGGRSTKGVGLGSSVLDLQQQLGNEQTIKTVLGPDVPGQFKAIAGRGKGGPLFFASSTYKQLSKLLVAYAAKQGAKSGSWRRGQVGTMDDLLDTWFAKKPKGKGEDEKSKRAAMTWLQPKVQQELRALNGATSSTETTSYAPVPVEEEPQSGYTGVPAKEEESPYTGVPAKEEQGTSGWTKTTGGGLRGEFALGGARKKAQDAKKNYLPEGTTTFEVGDEVSSLASATRSTGDESQEDPKKSASVSKTSSSSQASSSETEVEKLPDPKYSEYKQMDKHYKTEFKRGGVHLVDIYNFGVGQGPERDKIKTAVVQGWKWSPRTFDKYWDKLVTIFGGDAKSKPSVPSKELFKDIEISEVSMQNSNGSDLSPSAIEEKREDKRFNKAVGSWSNISVSTVESQDTDGNTISSDSKERRENNKKRAVAKQKWIDENVTDSEALLVKKKTNEEERAKYRLRLGTPIKRGPGDDTLDTKDMVSNASGAGFGIFVMGQDGQMYVGSHKVGVFHHSSFLAGANTAGAGEMKVSAGKLQMLTNKSGHYQPTHEQNVQVIAELKEAGVAPSAYRYKFFGPNNVKLEFDSAQKYLDEAVPNSAMSKVGKHLWK